MKYVFPVCVFFLHTLGYMDPTLETTGPLPLPSGWYAEPPTDQRSSMTSGITQLVSLILQAPPKCVPLVTGWRVKAWLDLHHLTGSTGREHGQQRSAACHKHLILDPFLSTTKPPSLIYKTGKLTPTLQTVRRIKSSNVSYGHRVGAQPTAVSSHVWSTIVFYRWWCLWERKSRSALIKSLHVDVRNYFSSSR